MSYTIERRKRVLHYLAPAEDKRFHIFPHLYLFIYEGACNNVSPRTFSENLLAIDANSHHPHHWDGRTQMPLEIWQMGYDADGGGIKPYNNNQDGISYLKQWRLKADEPEELVVAGRLAWMPELSLWANFAGDRGKLTKEALTADLSRAFEGIYAHERESVAESFRRLFPKEKPFKSDREGVGIYSEEQMRDALHLWRWRKELGFSVCLSQHTGK